jgi:hypothetical protein
MTDACDAPDDLHDAWQAIMDRCYERWSHGDLKGSSYDSFIAALEPHDAWAVVMGNLNYQVNNGGFLQWHDNGYSSMSDTLIEALTNVGTPAALEASTLITEAMDAIDLNEDAMSQLKKLGRYGECDALLTYEDLISDAIGKSLNDDLEPFDRRFYKVSDHLLKDVEEWVRAGCPARAAGSQGVA